MPNQTTEADRIAVRVSAGGHLALIAESYARLTGRALVDPGTKALELALWETPRVIVAHGTEARPRFFYGNRAALDLFEMGAAEFIGLPSDRSAEPVAREARAEMLAALDHHDLIDHYTGVRIAASGRRFEITGAQVWNLVDEQRTRLGQAATFTRWRYR